jgi:hypothetical protein
MPNFLISRNFSCDRALKVPKREIFDRSDFPDFYKLKSCWVGDLVVKILTYYFNFWGSIWFLTRMLSIHIRNWCVCSACESVTYAYAQHAHQFLTRMLSMVWRDLFQICNFYWGYKEWPFEKWENWCVCWAYASVPAAYAQHAHQFLVRMLSLRISSWRVCSAYA